MNTTMLVTCNALGSYDLQGSPLTYEFSFGMNHVESNTIGIASYAYENEGPHNIVLTIRNIQGQESKAYFLIDTYEVLPNQIPLANFYCHSNRINTLICQPTYAEDRDGTVVSYTYIFSDGVKIVAYSADPVEHQMPTSDSSPVYFFITDNLGADSVTVLRTETPVQNGIPYVAPSCLVEDKKIACNALSAWDGDGFITSIKWDFGNGNIVEGDFAEHIYDDFGVHNFSVTVTDNFSLSKTVDVNILIASRRPTAIADCYVFHQKLMCDGGSSISPDGSIAEYEWNIYNDNVLVDQIYGKKINYQFINTGNKSVILIVKDSYQNTAENSTGSFYIVNKAPVADFSCLPNEDLSLKCNSSFSSDDGVIVDYEWNYDGSIFKGPSQIFPANTISHNISLKITDNMGVSTTKIFNNDAIVNVEDSKSNGEVVVVSNTGSFHPVDETIKIKIVGVELSDNVLNNKISINDVLIESSDLVYNFNEGTIEISSLLLNGENEISLTVEDSEGKNIELIKLIYAGSKRVELNFKDETNLVVSNLSLRLISGENDSLEFSFNNLKMHDYLENVPDNMNFFIRASSGQMTGTSFLSKESDREVVELHSFSSVTTNENKDFSDGVIGWELKDSSYSITNGALELRANNQGRGILRRSLKSDKEKNFAAFPINIITGNKNDYVSIVMRNKETGLVIEKFYGPSRLQETNNVIDNSIPINNINEQIEFEVQIYSSGNDDIVTVLDYFLSAAMAINEGGTQVISNGYKLGEKFGDPKLFRVGGGEVTHIGIGSYPTYYDNNGNRTIMADPINGSPTNKIMFTLPAVEESYRYIEKILLVMKKGNYLREIKADETWTYLDGELRGKFFIPNEEARLVYPENIELSVKIIFKNNETTISKSFVENPYKTFISLTGHDVLQAHQRFGIKKNLEVKRDIELGGDDWIAPSLLGYVKNLMNTFDKRSSYGNLKSDDVVDLQVNDASLINGGSFPEHEAHMIGKNLDLLFKGYYEFGKGKDEAKGLAITARKLVRLLDEDPGNRQIYGVLVKYIETSSFDIELSNSCLSNGYIAKEMIKNHPKHGDHFHYNIASKPTPFSYPGRRTLKICSRLSADRNSIELRSCEYTQHSEDSLNNVDAQDLTASARVHESDQDFIVLSKNGNKFEIPTNLRNQLLELRVVDKANAPGELERNSDYRKNRLRTKGCGQQFIFVDSRTREYTCNEASEFVETYVNTSAYKALVVSEHSLIDELSAYYKLSFNDGAICGASTVSSVLLTLDKAKIINTKIEGSVGFLDSTLKNVSIRKGVYDEYLHQSNISGCIIEDSDIESSRIVDANITKSTVVESTVAGPVNINLSTIVTSSYYNVRFNWLTNRERYNFTSSSSICSRIQVEADLAFLNFNHKLVYTQFGSAVQVDSTLGCDVYHEN